MDAALSTVAGLLKTNHYVVKQCLDGLTSEEAGQGASGECNSIQWMMGHVTGGRCDLLKLLGVDKEYPWTELFKRGSKRQAPDKYPSLEEILPYWKDSGIAIASQLDAMTEEELSAPSPREYPLEDKSLRGAVCFLIWHESYHVGQMAYLKKWLGKGQAVG